MKFIYQGDLHLRDKAPVNRKDDYISAQWRKLEQLIACANEHEATLLLGGDIFDSPRVSAETVNKAMDIFNCCDGLIYAVLGQHDVPFHVMDLRKSPVYSLRKSNSLFHVNRSSFIYNGPDEKVWIRHHNWESDDDVPITEPQAFKIFLGHVSVFDSVPGYWKGEGYTPKTLREEFPGYDLYLCGDIHIPLVDHNVIVSGSMMRQSINEAHFKPRCYLIELIGNGTHTVTPLYYEIEKDVFNVVHNQEVTPLDLSSLVEALKSSSAMRTSFRGDCLALAKDKPEVKSMIEEIFDELD